MRKTLRILPVLAAAAFLAGCQGPCQKINTLSGPALTSGSADFSNVASVGTSISAGFQSNGLVDRHQIHAFPALFAAQVGMTVTEEGTGSFTFDGINLDGIPALWEIKSLSPLVIDNVGRTTGAPMNASQPTPYHSLAIPGQLAVDFVDSTFYTGPPNAVHPNRTFFNIVYRNDYFHMLGINQLAAVQPTFVMYELGSNEVLGSVVAGNANIFPTAGYISAMQAGLNAIHALLPNAKVAVFNVPNVTSFPFATTFPPVTLSLLTGTPVPLLGPSNVPLAPGDRVLLTAGALLATGQGFPLNGYNYVNPAAPGTGVGLPGSVVLDETEQATITTSVVGMNDALAAYVAANPTWTTLVDLNALLDDIHINGYKVGSTTYTSDFVTGGLFSLDGVHPNDLAHAIICNTLIDAVNRDFGSTVPHLNLSEFATASSSRAQLASGEKPYPVSFPELFPLWSSH